MENLPLTQYFYCKSMVDAHHGEIFVKSYGYFMGASFTLELPLAK